MIFQTVKLLYAIGDNMKNHILISELANTYHISRPTLIYYDKIGLLVPTHDKKTGYRYYSSADMDRLELILALKETNMSLTSIKTFLDSPTHQSNIHLLQLRKIQIQQKIAELKSLELGLDKQIELIRNKNH